MHARYTVRAVADPQTVPRLINYFAQQALIPSRIAAELDYGVLTVEIGQPGIAHANARIIAEKMRASVLVESVSLTFQTSEAAIPVPV